MEIVNTTLGDVIKTHRTALGLTQAELARRVGCAEITVRKLEANTLRPSVQLSELLALALSLPEKDHIAFVRLARKDPPLTPIPTPSPLLEEIGGEDLSGRAIRGYELGKRLNVGGFGAVYEAVQTTVERDVAVKIILPKYANHPEFIRRFEVEAQLVARLEHPHIVPLYDYWREPDVAYLVMQLMRGGSLEHMLKSGPLAPSVLMPMLLQVGSALHTAHQSGVIHRDIKPANILLDTYNNAYLADFGIAKNLGLDDRTQVGTVIGSSAYISPEQIKAESINAQADIYSLGVMVYELLTGSKPFQGPTPLAFIHQHLNEQIPHLPEQLPVQLETVLLKATAKTAVDRYKDVPSFLNGLQAALSKGKTAVSPGTHPPSIELSTTEFAKLENPYKGLRAFSESDATNFFGRETLIQSLLTRLADGSDLSRFLAIIGPSGSGKSSVAKAGLIPSLRRGGIPGSDKWFIIEMTPGSHPFEELEAALLRVAVNPPESLLTQLQENDRGLLRAVKRILPTDPEVDLFLLIDQFEELFTLTKSETVRAAFLDSLVSAALDPHSRLRIAITLRADFNDRPLQYIDFGDLVRQRSEFILPLTPDELEQAIVRPVQRLGLTVAPDLIAAMTRDVGGQPGALPLLQYALTELFDRREGPLFTLASYEASGGVMAALGHRADEIYNNLEAVQQQTTCQLFMRLVTLGEGIEDTRRRVPLAELQGLSIIETQEELQTLLDHFGRYRLLTFDRNPITRGATVEVAHEALIREWKLLREWLAESRHDIRLQRLLATAVMEWQESSQDESYLLRGSRLAQFENWAQETAVALTAGEHAFLQSSITAREEKISAEEERRQRELETAQRLVETERLRADEQAESAQGLRKRAFALAGVLVIAILFAIAAATFANQSQDNANVAATRQVEAVVNADLAATREIEAAYSASLAVTRETEAIVNANLAATRQVEAENEANLRATAEVNAIQDREIAEEQRAIAETQSKTAQSRELAAAALNTLTEDPELSVLLALEALSLAHTLEAENALHKSVPALHLLATFSNEDVVWDVVISPDENHIATADGGSGQISVWDIVSGDKILTLTADNEAVTKQAMSVDYAPNGRLLAAGGREGILHIWDALSGEEVNAIATGSGINKVRFDPQCQSEETECLVISAQQNSTAQIWDVATGQNVAAFAEHEPTSSINFPTEHGLWDAALSNDGTLLATADMSGLTKIWDVATKKELHILPGQGSDIRQVAFSPDDTALATAGLDSMVTVWDMADGDILLRIPHVQPVNSVTYNEDGTRLVTTSWDGIVRIWDAGTGRKEIDLLGHSGMTLDAEFSSDGQLLFSGGVDGTAKIWDLSPDKEVLTVSGHGIVLATDFSPDGQSFVTAGVDSTAQIWDAATGESRIVFTGHQAPINGANFSPDGTELITGSFDATVKVWDVASGAELNTLSGYGSPIRSSKYSPNGAYIAASDETGEVFVWDANTGELLWSHNEHNALTIGIAFSPDSTRLISGSWENWVALVWDVSSGELLFELPADQDVFNLSFSPDNRLVAVPTRAGTTTIWDVSGAEPIKLFELNSPAAVISASFSPNGDYLGTTHFDGTSAIWDFPASLDTGSGQALLNLKLHTNIATSMDFSPDNKYVVTGGFDNTARVFTLDLDELIAMAESRVTRPLTDSECQQYLHLSVCP